MRKESRIAKYFSRFSILILLKSNQMDNKRSRVTIAQQRLLCDFFESNPEVLCGYKKVPECVEAVQTKWKKITPQLNALGPSKNYKSWPKYLSDLKAKLKRKKVKWQQNNDGTGPVICNAEEFNEMYLRMLVQVLKKEPKKRKQEPSDENISESKPNTSGTFSNNVFDNESRTETNICSPIPTVSDFEDSDVEEFSIQSDLKSETLNPNRISDTITQRVNQREMPGVFVYPNDGNDEFDTFARNIAQQLRTMPLAVALETQEIILSILRKQRVKVSDKKSCNGNFDPLEKH